MLSLVLHALKARRAQGLAVFAIALLAGLGCASAPWLVSWGREAVAEANVTATAGADRLVLVSGTVRYEAGGASPLRLLADRVAEQLGPVTAGTEVGARFYASIRGAAETEPLDLYLVARDGVCEQLTMVSGRCATGAGEVVLVRAVAESLGVAVGDQITATGIRLSEPRTLTVSGVYEVADPYAEYWVTTALLEAGPNPAFVAETTLLGLRPDRLELSAQSVLPPSVFVDPAVDIEAILEEATAALRADELSLQTSAGGLIDRISHDRWLVLLGVGVGTGQLLLVSWVGLFLAVRHTSQPRRGDIGLLKLRGVSTWRVWLVVALAGGVPMLAGTRDGAAAGLVAAAGVARDDPLAVARAGAWSTLWLSLGAAAVAGLGGLVVAVVAEWRTLRTPVVDLLRRVPGRHRGWRADVADLVIVALAAAGVYQGTVADDDSALALLAPALVGLAVAMIVARALPLAAARWGAAALHAGRIGSGLAALHLARRQSTQRIFAVLVVAVAVFTGTSVSWASASAAWSGRAVQELGADRVLSVAAANTDTLLAAVRAVDPEGRYAMAVATTSGPSAVKRVVAVDAERFARVGRLPGGEVAGACGGTCTPAELAALLRPEPGSGFVGQPPSVRDGPLTLDATAPDGVGLRVHLSTVDGQARVVEFAPGESSATVEGCDPVCRLVALEPVVVEVTQPVLIEIRALRPLLDASMLGDITLWRTTFVEPVLPPHLGARDGRLTITLPLGPAPVGVATDLRIFPITTPVPVPVVLAGPAPQRAGDSRVSALGGTDVPLRVAARVSALPVPGGYGLLVDLGQVVRDNDAAKEWVDLAVWLTADAPEALVTALADHGVTVLGEKTTDARTADFASFGPGLALRFGVLAAIVILLLAAGVAVVGSTVDHDARVAELVALRGQGLPVRLARVAAYAGTVTMVAGATLTGVLAAGFARALVPTGLPVFSDRWFLSPTEPRLTPVTLLVVAAVLTVVLGAAAVSGAVRLARAVRSASWSR